MLEKLNIAEFADKLSAKDVPLGAGSASALTGLLGAGMLKMAVNCALTNPSLSAQREFFLDNLTRLDHLSGELTALIDRDASVLAELFEIFTVQVPKAPNGVEGAERMEGTERTERTEVPKLPHLTDSASPARQKKMEDSLFAAAKVPLQTADACLKTLEIALKLAPLVESNLKSELMSAVICAHAGATSAIMSSAVNLSHLKDAAFSAFLAKEIQSVKARADELKNLAEKIIFKDYPFNIFIS